MVTESWPGAAGSNINGDQAWTEFGADWVKNGDGSISPSNEITSGIARMDVDLTANHYAEVDVTQALTSATSGKAGPAVRVSAAGTTYYAFASVDQSSATFGRNLLRVVNGAGGRIEPRLDGVLDADGNRLRLEVVDNAAGFPVLTCFIDGVEVYSHVDTAANRILGNQRTGVFRGTGTAGATNASFSNFEAGTLTELTPIGTYYQGAATDDGFTVAAYIRDTHDIRIAYDTNEAMSSPEYTAEFAAQSGYLKFPVDDLLPATQYWWCFEVDGVLDDEPRARIRTAPVQGRGDFTFVTASCAGVGPDGYTNRAFRSTTNAPSFQHALNRSPDMVVHLGDFHYRDVASLDVESWRAAYRDVLGNPLQAALFHAANLAYVWDDHDYGDNTDTHAPAKASALATYKEMVPHYPLGVAGGTGSAPIAQTFVYGPARFVMLDVRSGRDYTTSPPTMLGAAQLAWLDTVLAAATERVIFLCVISPWNATASVGQDHWGGFAAERTAISNMLVTYGLMSKTIILAGDMHGMAWDSGTNNRYATGAPVGCPVFQFAPWDGSNSTKGGPYSGGTHVTSNQQYGYVEVNDGVDELTVTLSGWAVSDPPGATETQRFSQTFSFEGNPVVDLGRTALIAPATPHPDPDVVITATKGLAASDQTATINAQIAAITSGSSPTHKTVTMAPGVYRVDGEILIDGKAWLDFWLQGVTFQATVDSETYDERRHFTIQGSNNITLRGHTVRGTHPYGGTQDAAYVVSKEFQHGYRIYLHCQDILLTHCNVFDVWGDFLYVGAGSTNARITVRKGEFRRNGRQGAAIVQGTDFRFEDNVLSDIRRSFFDVEPNTAAQSVNGVYVRRNRLEASTAAGPGWTSAPQRLSWFANLGPASSIQNVYFEDNWSAGAFKGASGRMDSDRYNLVIRRNTFLAPYGTPGGGALTIFRWHGVELTDNYVPLQTRTPPMYVIRATNCTDLIDGGGNEWPGGEGLFDVITV
jgi:phosphodiesterase/alkaline phosphatase D-like protein